MTKINFEFETARADFVNDLDRVIRPISPRERSNMEIINLEKLGNGDFIGWVRDGKFYKRFSTSRGKVKVEVFVPVNNYRNYDHFANVFAGHTGELFFQNPIPIDELTVKELSKAYERRPK